MTSRTTLCPWTRRHFPGGLKPAPVVRLAVGFCLLVAMAAAAQGPSPTPAPGPEELIALPPHKTLTLGGEASHRYYLLPTDGAVTFSLEGPATLELTSRALFTDSRQVLGYALLYRLDGGSDQRIDVGGIDRDLGQTFSPATEGAPAYPLRHRLAVGEGWHSLEVRRGDGQQPVAVRATAQRGPSRSLTWQTIEPARPPGVVALRSRDGSAEDYYRLSDEKGLRLEPPAPGFLRLQIHSDHLPSQPSQFRYQIEVRRDGKPFRLYHLLGTKSSEWALLRGSSRPGARREIIFPVDPGQGKLPSHYLIRPAIGSGRTFYGRVQFSSAEPSP